jgi:outer membrane protein OmpA-like peptidoglycan-associated protein
VGGDIESLAAVTTYKNELADIRIAVDGSYATMYVNEQRVANMPVLQLERQDFMVFVIGGRENDPTFITDLRIAAGGTQLYDRLIADGRVSTQGIYFDSGSDTIRPESTGTLMQIGRMLEQNPELRIRIEGHTDNVGDAEMNRVLSERRANSVMTYLVSEHGVDTSRLEAVGRGDTDPVANNDTEAGRQNNRRVELVRL